MMDDLKKSLLEKKEIIAYVMFAFVLYFLYQSKGFIEEFNFEIKWWYAAIALLIAAYMFHKKIQEDHTTIKNLIDDLKAEKERKPLPQQPPPIQVKPFNYLEEVKRDGNHTMGEGEPYTSRSDSGSYTSTTDKRVRMAEIQEMEAEKRRRVGSS